MPFRLMTPGKGKEKDAVPHYLIRGKKEQMVFLAKFLTLVEKRAEEYYTEDPEAGQEYLDQETGDISIQDAVNRGSDRVVALIELAKEEGVSPQKILDAIKSSIVPEPGPAKMDAENLLYSVPVHRLNVDINQFNGFINREPAHNLYEALSAGFDEETLEKIHDKTLAFSEIVDDKMEIELPVTYGWHAIIDEDLFKDKMIEVLEMAVDEIEERKPAAAHLLSTLAGLV